MRVKRGKDLSSIIEPPAPQKEADPSTDKHQIHPDLERFVSMTDGMPPGASVTSSQL